MSQKVVLVTGSSAGGIGFSLCETFAAAGCKVYATSRRLESMKGFAHANIQILEMDVTKDESIKKCVDHIIEREGYIDIVVNNAGTACHGPTLDMPLELVEQTYQANTFSILRVTRAVVPHMAARKSGIIVNNASIAGETPFPWSGIYSSSKAAAISLSDTLYMELKDFGIHVMTVAPGGVVSQLGVRMFDHLATPEGSLYGNYYESVLRRINGSQKNAMPTDVFSKRVVKAVLKRSPPQYMTLGKMSGFNSFLKWLPRTFLLNLLWFGVMLGVRKKE